MSVWKDFGDERDDFFSSDDELRLNHEEFDQWLNSINESGDPEKDQEAYDTWVDEQAEAARGLDYPEWVIQTPKYVFRLCLN